MKRQLHIWLGALAVAILAASLVVTGCSLPQIRTASVPGGVPQEGIKVHGHWTIEVKNPDGTLVKRTEFDNALHSEGGASLCKILGRENSVGGWYIRLGSIDPPFLFGEAEVPGLILEESSGSGTEGYISNNLTVDVPTSGDNAGKLVLRGTTTAGRNGQIAYVGTQLELLSATSPPGSSYGGETSMYITVTTLSSAVSVTTGQLIVVTVVISFS